MAKVSREQAAMNKDAIAEASARLFREHGLNGVSVAELMAAVGLTHGGFYGHFGSKDELAAQACARAFAQRAQYWQAKLEEGDAGPALLAEMVEAYLSPRHRDNLGGGCTAVALAGDLSREAAGKPVHDAFVGGVCHMAVTLQRLAGGDVDADPGGAQRTQALARLATLVGAVTLARATKSDPISDEILAAAKLTLLPEETPHG